MRFGLLTDLITYAVLFDKIELKYNILFLKAQATEQPQCTIFSKMWGDGVIFATVLT